MLFKWTSFHTRLVVGGLLLDLGVDCKTVPAKPAVCRADLSGARRARAQDAVASEVAFPAQGELSPSLSLPFSSRWLAGSVSAETVNWSERTVFTQEFFSLLST